MDWGICHYTAAGGAVHKVPVFVMVLGHSRAKYTDFASHCDLASLERCMVNAFTYFGGMPEKVLTDNMKTVIIGRDSGKPVWNPAFEEFSVDRGFVPKVCAPRRPQTIIFPKLYLKIEGNKKLIGQICFWTSSPF